MIIVYAIFIFIFGALLTSFYHVIGHRVPINESIKGRSSCDSCHHELRWIDITPIFGYLINKGKCHYCHTKIPICHLLLEIFGGLLFMMTYLIYGFTLEFLVLFIVISVFMIESISDIKYRIVIDRVWMIGIIPLVVVAIIQKEFLTHLISAVVLFSLLLVIAWIAQKITKKEALGGGDVKLFLFIGFVLTYQQGILALFIASLFGFIYGMIILRNNKKEIPLVPFIFVSVMVTYLYGQELINWYVSLLGM